MPALAVAVLAHPKGSQFATRPPDMLADQRQQSPDEGGAIMIGNARHFAMDGPMPVEGQANALGKFGGFDHVGNPRSR